MLSKRQALIWILIAAIPSIAWASYRISMGRYRAPAALVSALNSAGVRVTELCRSPGARYGASNSAHHRCQAADIGRETTERQRAFLRARGWCPQWHTAGTAPHWHVVKCGDTVSRRAAADRMRSRIRSIRNQHRAPRDSRNRGYNHRKSYGVR